MKTRDQIIAENKLSIYMSSIGVNVERKAGEYICICPFHDDHNPSLRLNDDKGVYFCDACHAAGTIIDLIMHYEQLSVGEAMRRLGGEEDPAPKSPAKKPPLEHVATYTYCDEAGTPVYQVYRYEPKTFKQAHFGPDGRPVWGMKDIRRVLYNLPEVLASDRVWIVEGEKDADLLMDLGIVATTNVGGAGKFLEAYVDWLQDKEIVLCPDNDAPGQTHMAKIRGMLAGRVKWIKQIKIPPPYKDVGALLDVTPRGEGDVALAQLVQRAPTLIKGLDVPVMGFEQALEEYKAFARTSEKVGFDLARLFPEMEGIRPLVPGNFCVIMAATGTGKTAWLQHVVRNARPLKVLFFELELAIPEMVERFVAGYLNKPMWGVLKTFKLDDDLHPDLPGLDHIYTYSKGGVHVDAMPHIIKQSELVIGRLPDVVVVDYITLVGGRGNSRRERVAYVAEKLKAIARELNVIVIAASQIKRKEDEEPGLFDAKEAGEIENSASPVISLWREPDANDIMNMKVLKNNRGRSGHLAQCTFTGANMSLEKFN